MTRINADWRTMTTGEASSGGSRRARREARQRRGWRQRLALLPAMLLLAACQGAGPDAAGVSDGGEMPAIVACLDPERGTVSRVPDDRCDGTVVSEDQADRAARDRADRVRSAMLAPPVRTGDGGIGSRHLIGAGTGFFVGDQGEVLTNWHVVQRCEALSIDLDGGGSAGAMVAAREAEHDLALLRSTLSRSAGAVFNAYPGRAYGHRLSVVGFPAERFRAVRSTLTPSMAAPDDLSTGNSDYVLLGAVRGGHSGSPVLDEAGRVVGIVKARRAPGTEPISAASADMGLAVSNASIWDFLQENGVEVRRAGEAVVLSDDEILARARGFVVRVECWR